MKQTKNIYIYFVIGIVVTLMMGAFTGPAGAAGRQQRDLSVGKIGNDVRQLQMQLSRRGFNLEPYDGIFGMRTHQAVVDIQKKNHIKVTGVWDEATRRALAHADRKDRPQVSRSISRKELMMLARIVHGEARGEPFEGQVAVAAVVLNRMESGEFPESVQQVVAEPGAFDAYSDGQVWLDPDQNAIKAAQKALSGYDPTGQALYYYNPAKTTNAWIWSRPVIKRIGQHVFAR